VKYVSFLELDTTLQQKRVTFISCGLIWVPFYINKQHKDAREPSLILVPLFDAALLPRAVVYTPSHCG